MRQAAAAGALRLGLLHAGETAIAAQLWTVAGGTASVLKLAHDEAYKPLSPGTVLTARMIARLIDGEGVAALDFGRGDDPYKRLWTTRRRQRIGLFLAAPWHPAGAATLLRQALGQLRRRWRAG
jgi:CelD/BcsL family acetyltransferase involved in cellulose biosynthesis